MYLCAKSVFWLQLLYNEFFLLLLPKDQGSSVLAVSVNLIDYYYYRPSNTVNSKFSQENKTLKPGTYLIVSIHRVMTKQPRSPSSFTVEDYLWLYCILYYLVILHNTVYCTV